MASVRCTTAALLAGFLLAPATFAEAQAEPRPAGTVSTAEAATAPAPRDSWWNREESRTLATHTFIPPLLQQTAFVTTHFGVRQGATVFIVPDVALDFGKDDLRAAGFTQSFDLGIAITDYLGLYGTLAGTVTSGINAASAFEIGGDLEAAFELGAILRLARFEPLGTQLALRLSGGMALENDFNVAQFAEAGQEASGSQIVSVRQSEALALLVTPARSRTFGATLLVAQTIIEQIGLQASLSVRRIATEVKPFDLQKDARVDEAVDELQVAGALALNLDASSFGVPLALMPEYQIIHQAVSTEDDAGAEQDLTYSSHYAAFGLYYSGRPNLVLGLGGVVALNLEQDRLEWNAADGAPRKSGTPSKRQGQFVLRYVW